MLPEVMTKAEWCRIPTYKLGYTYTVSMHGMYVDFPRCASGNQLDHIAHHVVQRAHCVWLADVFCVFKGDVGLQFQKTLMGVCQGFC